MITRVQHPEFRHELEPVPYPFNDDATLTNGVQMLLPGTFLDASFYPIGGGIRMYLSKATITHSDVTLFIGDEITDELCSSTFDLITPPDVIQFVDTYGRPAGLVVSESLRLGIFQTWGTGTHTFDYDQTGLVATVCIPTPEIGVRGFLLDDGSVVAGDTWMVGDDGVVLRVENITVPSPNCSGETITQRVVRVDVVGDPLFRRRLCGDTDLFATPRFIKQITFQDGEQTFVTGPDEYGDLKITINNDLAADTVMRTRPTDEGLLFEAMGTKLQSVI